MNTFFAVSTGPARSDYLTLGAVKALNRCGTIFYPVTGGEKHVAFDCVREAVDVSRKNCIGMKFSMTTDEKKTSGEYDDFCAQVEKALVKGDVAMVAIGDVSVYSTAARIGKMLRKKGVPVSFVSGVTSFCAAAGEFALDLAEADEGIRIVPGDAFFSAGKIDSVLDDAGAKIFMKSPRHLKEIIDIALKKKPTDKLYLVQGAGYENKRLFSGRDLDNLPAEVFDKAYMSVLIVM